MVTFDLLQFMAVAFMACGLLAIVLEILLGNPRWLWEIVSDVRRFAGQPVQRSGKRDTTSEPISKTGKSRDPRISA